MHPRRMSNPGARANFLSQQAKPSAAKPHLPQALFSGTSILSRFELKEWKNQTL
jgi:hypothetical protein